VLIFLVSNFVLRAVYVENAIGVHAPRSDAGTGMLTDATPLLLNLSLLQTFWPTWLETGINPSWSLTTELTFYAVLPILAVALVGRFKHRLAAALLPAVLLWLAGLIGRVWAEHLYAGMPGISSLEAEYGPHPVAVLSRSLLGLGDMFAAGMVVAVLFVWTERGELPWWNRRRAKIVAGCSIMVGIVGAASLHEIHPWFVGAFTALVAGGAIMLIADPEARREPSVIVRLVGWPPAEYLGKISLSVYLWHYPVLILLTRAHLFTVDSIPVAIGSTVTVAVLAVALGSLTYTWVERPALTGKRPRRLSTEFSQGR
jgi:peptidoglycan/LPS O-acetylase OafA/YrhL